MSSVLPLANILHKQNYDGFYFFSQKHMLYFVFYVIVLRIPIIVNKNVVLALFWLRNCGNCGLNTMKAMQMENECFCCFDVLVTVHS